MLDEWITSVKLLGSRQQLKWRRDPDGLKVELLESRPGNYAFVLRIARVEAKSALIKAARTRRQKPAD